jgi:hypothetical protein
MWHLLVIYILIYSVFICVPSMIHVQVDDVLQLVMMWIYLLLYMYIIFSLFEVIGYWNFVSLRMAWHII